MGFDELWQQTFKEVKAQYSPILKISLLWWILPFAVFGLLGIAFFFGTGMQDDIASFMQLATQQQTPPTPESEEQLAAAGIGFFIKLLILIPLFFIAYTILFFLILLGTARVIAPSFLSKRWTYKDAVQKAKPLYWRFVGLIMLLMLIFAGVWLGGFIVIMILTILGAIVSDVLVLFMFVVGLTGTVIIFVYLFVQWMFSPYFLLHESMTVGEAMRASWYLVSGKWWKVFGYSFFIGVIFACFYIVLVIFEWAMGLLLGIPSQQGIFMAQPAPELFLASFGRAMAFNIGFTLLFYLLYYLFAFPFILLFFKNFYLALVGKNKITKSKK